MPIYMDRHDLSIVTAKDVAEAHQEDLKIQHNYGCRGLTYWFDEVRGTAFCLIEAPDETAVKEMHKSAHGLVPYEIIEVDSNVVNAFLGRIEDPVTSQNPDDSGFPVINEPAFRAIMVTTLMDSALMISKYGKDQTHNLLNIQNDLVQNTVEQFNGLLAKQTAEGFIVSFPTVAKAISCALDIQKKFAHYNKNNPSTEMCIRIGISAGSPVTKDSDFFEQAVCLAKRLSSIAAKNQVLISSNVRELLKENGLNTLTNNDAVRALTPPEEQFLNNLFDKIEKIWNEPDLDVESFSRHLGQSRSQLYRKTTSLMGYSPNDFIKEFRLNKSLELLDKQYGNITDVAFQSGFSNPSYFSKCFKERFGLLPSDYTP